MHLKATNVLRAERYWAKHGQNQEFNLELGCLACRRAVKLTSGIVDLNPFTDAGGFLRVSGRLSLLNSPSGVKHPILLPAKHR